MIEIRTMNEADVPFGMRLKDQAGWNQTVADWQRFLTLEPEGCFVAERDGRSVGTTVTCMFGSIAWIAMVLVDSTMRKRGIGTRLVEHALRHLEDRNIRTIRLDATPLGKPVYERLGFRADFELTRWEGGSAGGSDHPCVGPLSADELELAAQLDCQAAGTDRRRLLRLLHQTHPDAVLGFIEGGKMFGYLAHRTGARAVQIGPAVAITREAGEALLDAALEVHRGLPVFVDIPVANLAARRYIERAGLRAQRPLTRMSRGEPVHDQPAQIWASSGPEKG